MKQKLTLWIEDYLFFPNSIQKILSILLLPLTFLYLLIILLKRLKSNEIDFGIKIVSVGNIIIGGSGKTPITIELAKSYEKAFIILRGYGRNSKGLKIVCLDGEIKCDVNTSGDEAMLLSKSIPNANVIVSEDRIAAILKAKELGAKIIFLDDGFSKYNIKKFDILLRPEIEPTNIFCIPSGGYREPKSAYSYADIVLKEGVDFTRTVSLIKNNKHLNVLPLKCVLVTAISKPKRLLKFLPENISYEFFEDHHSFTKEEIDAIIKQYPNYSILTTKKDYVKLEKFDIEDICIMDLSLDIKNKDIILDKINNY